MIRQIYSNFEPGSICGAGTYTDTHGATSCTKAPHNTYTDGSDRVKNCAENEYTGYTGASHPSECRTCETGYSVPKIPNCPFKCPVHRNENCIRIKKTIPMENNQ